MLTYSKATLAHVPELARLEQTHLNDELSSGASSNQLSGQGFNVNELKVLINKHYLILAEDNGRIVGYVIAAAWDFFTPPIYNAIVKRLPRLDYDGPKLNVNNSCQYGPIWVSPDYRGKGVFAELVTKLKGEVKHKYANMVTFIAEDNGRSFAAHTAKANMQVVDFFSFERRDYYLLLSAL